MSAYLEWERATGLPINEPCTDLCRFCNSAKTTKEPALAGYFVHCADCGLPGYVEYGSQRLKSSGVASND